MTDSRHDPRFPDRPQTQDFWRLSEIALEHDAMSDDRPVTEIVGDVIDHGSLSYMLRHRLLTILPGVAGTDLETILTAIGTDAFMLGAKFIQRGDHRPDETGTTPEKGA